MKNFISKHLYKSIYLFVFIMILSSVYSFEARIRRDRKGYTTERTISAYGTVKSVPSLSRGTLSFTFEPLTDISIKELMYVRINHGEMLKLCMGDKIRLTGTCSVPEGALNPGAFDFESFIKSKGASVVLTSDIAMVQSIEKGFLHPIYSLRQRVSDRVSQYISPNEAGLVNALITGDKDMIPNEYGDFYRRAGVYHIVAVSGLHLNMLILFLSFLYGGLRLTKKRKAVVSFALTLAGCGFMFVFTGFGISVERAAFMALIVCAAGIFSREYCAFASLFAVFALILITEPRFISDASFCLSFSSTTGILAGASAVRRINIRRFRLLWESVGMSLCVSLTTLPFTVHYFGAISIASPFSNLIVLSIAPILLGLSYLFALVCIPCPEVIVRIFANLVTTVAYCVNSVSRLFASLPLSYIYTTEDMAALIILCAAAVLLFVKFKSRAVRMAIAAIIIIANIVGLSYNKLVPHTDVTFLNAGQGDSSLIHSSDGLSVMIDCGSETISGYGENQALPYLRNQGISKLDLMIVTHFHTDHVSGVTTLIESGYIRKLILPDRPLLPDEESAAEEIYKAAVMKNIPICHVSAGDTLSVGDHRIEVLSPQNVRYPNANDGSLVIRYTYKGSSVLFCGDIEAAGQYKLLDTMAPCDILKVAHHGADSSMSQKFSDEADCAYAVISCGAGNRYSHPSDTTLKAYKDSVILRTDRENGPISFTINPNGIRRKNNAQH